jgi:tetratricopeptide (TPR) repeat protein
MQGFIHKLRAAISPAAKLAGAPNPGSEPALVKPETESSDVSSVRAAVVSGDWPVILHFAASAAWRTNGIDEVQARAQVLTKWRRYREAILDFRRLCDARPDAPTLASAAWCHYLAGDNLMAVDLARRATYVDPLSVDAQFALAVSCRSTGDFASARQAITSALKSSPHHADVWLEMANVAQGEGRIAEAEAALRRAIELNPQSASAWSSLGSLLQISSRARESEIVYGRARECEIATGEDAHTTAHRAVALVEMGRYLEAIDLCESVIPDSPDAAINAPYSYALLATGRLGEGWEQYESRWAVLPMRDTRVRDHTPVWTGQPIQGKTILLRAEQGLGDVIQFARYATGLKKLGATEVMLQVHAGMRSLSQGFADVDFAFETLESPRPIDYYVHLMSLPRILGTDHSSIPANVPYLHLDAASRAKWEARLAGGAPKIGFVWAGNPGHPRDHQRSIPIAALAPLLKVPGIRCYSLQKELRESDAGCAPNTLEYLGPELADLCDAAAAIEQLDLLITVDTGLAHLGGALGKPVWMLIAEPADYRWLEQREDSPWYPSMRIFRQASTGDWSAPVARIERDLYALAGGDRSVLRLGSGRSTLPDWFAGKIKPDTRESPRPGITRFIEGREGIFQCIPSLDDEAVSIESYGEYRSAHLQVLEKVLPVDGTVLEAGSGLGSHALWLARVLSPDAEIILYEARPLVRRLLVQNLEANQRIDRVTLPRGTLMPATAGATPVTAIGGNLKDPLCTIDQLQLRKLDLLKINDSENALGLIDGARETIWRYRPALFVVVRDVAHAHEVAAACNTVGYRSGLMSTPLFNPLNHARLGDDVFGGRAALSVLALPEELPSSSWLDDLDILSAEAR